MLKVRKDQLSDLGVVTVCHCEEYEVRQSNPSTQHIKHWCEFAKANK